jgi:hypothetical protein
MKARVRTAVLLALGLLQMAGDLLGQPGLKGLGATLAASPAPRVFTSVRGLETFSTRFALEWRGRDGADHRLEPTPEMYGRIRGPYNRRNVYGAALSYGPVLATDPRTRPMLEAALSYSLCGDAPLLRELGIDPADIQGPVRIRFEPLPGTPPALPRTLVASCS